MDHVEGMESSQAVRLENRNGEEFSDEDLLPAKEKSQFTQGEDIFSICFEKDSAGRIKIKQTRESIIYWSVFKRKHQITEMRKTTSGSYGFRKRKDI